MKITTLRSVTAALCFTACALTGQVTQNSTRLVPAGNAGAGLTPVNVGPLKRENVEFAAIPTLDKGPRELIPTEIFIRRSISADFEGHYTQTAQIFLPIYYHAGYLSLDEQGKAEMRELEKEFSGLMSDYESVVGRFSDFMTRYQALHEKGRPRGVIAESELLVPYAGSDSKVKDGFEMMKLVKQSPGSPASPTAAVSTAPASVTNVTPRR
jgi:hypothetical protein